MKYILLLTVLAYGYKGQANDTIPSSRGFEIVKRINAQKDLPAIPDTTQKQNIWVVVPGFTISCYSKGGSSLKCDYGSGLDGIKTVCYLLSYKSWKQKIDEECLLKDSNYRNKGAYYILNNYPVVDTLKLEEELTGKIIKSVKPYMPDSCFACSWVCIIQTLSKKEIVDSICKLKDERFDPEDALYILDKYPADSLRLEQRLVGKNIKDIEILKTEYMEGMWTNSSNGWFCIITTYTEKELRKARRINKRFQKHVPYSLETTGSCEWGK